MKEKLFKKITTMAILIPLILNLSSFVALAQKTTDAVSQRVQQPGDFSFIDAVRTNLGESQTLQCGAASRNPGWSANSALIKADLSFGLIPASPDTLGGRERYIGSWAVRSIFPADGARPETISSIYFDGFLTSGSMASLKGGGRGYDIYGSANFTGSLCEPKPNYETRYYARFTGACGINQDINFELSTRPPVNNGLGNYFEDSNIYARGLFKGNVVCSTTNDVRRVRSDLSRRR